ncbi:MAG: hypothetical protein ACRD1E_02855, partial [Terriglobales bacterium]
PHACARRQWYSRAMSPRPQLSIWFFIGALLAAYGALILAAGLAQLAHPAPVVLARLHAGVWWGGCLLALGLLYLFLFRPRRQS